jgi:hypothetical protein
MNGDTAPAVMAFSISRILLAFINIKWVVGVNDRSPVILAEFDLAPRYKILFFISEIVRWSTEECKKRVS